MSRSSAARALAAAVPILVAIAIVVPFAMRSGSPGMRHDWLWPSDRETFVSWYQNGLSAWYPNGFGSPQDSPTVDLPLMFFAVISFFGASSELTLAIALVVWLSVAQYGMYACLRILDVRLDTFAKFALGAAYAFGPVAFQKLVAGHLYYVCAYAVLPFFIACTLKAVERRSGWWRFSIFAGLLLSVMSAQIQFVGFGCIIAAVFALSSQRPGRALLQCLPIVSIGLLHNVVLLVNLAVPAQTQGLMAQHSTYQWEVDLSTPLRAALLLSGYVGYDQRALSGVESAVYLFGKCVLLFAAVAGVAAAMRRAAYRRAAIAISIIAAFALVWATGLFGPLAPVWSAMLYGSPFFTLVREFYHVMALYAVCVTLLASFALAALPRNVQRFAAVMLLFVALPFAGGLERQVPTVPESLQSSSRCNNVENLCGLLPLDEPVGTTGASDTFGRDPAVLTTQAAGAENGPLFLHYAVGADKPAQLLSDLGLDTVAWRPGIISRLPNNYEPNVGASFDDFISSQKRLQERFRSSKTFEARPVATIETAGSTSALDAALPDSTVPSGDDLPFSYSFDDNDIRATWVSSRMWYWAYPKLLATSGVPVFTKSRTALIIPLRKRAGYLYVLAVAKTVECNARKMTPLPLSSSSPYRWYEISVSEDVTQARLVVDGEPVVAVARAVFSSDGSWRALRAVARQHRSVPVAIHYRSPSFSGAVPGNGLPKNAVLVLARTYSPELHLFVNGIDRGGPSRVHGFFNKWKLQPTDAGAAFTISSVYQRRSDLLNGIASAVSVLAFLFAVCRRPQSVAS